MFKITETYKDFNDVERTEDFYFHLNQAELMEWEMSTAGGMVEMLQKIVAAQDAPTLIATFKDLLLRAYGQKRPDGRGFVKTQQLRDEFVWHPAYPQIYMKLAFDADFASKFINGIVPAEMNSNVNPQLAQKPIN